MNSDWYEVILVSIIVIVLILVAIVTTGAPTDPSPKRWFYLPEKGDKLPPPD